MEVHHHPHVEKKNFKEYLREFLMIFLAVTLGFFAENIREHIANNETEKRNMEIIVNNLKDDTARLHQAITLNESKVKMLDTLLSFQDFSNPDTLHSDAFYALFIRGFSVFYFISNKTAIEQMKSSGSLRLIKSKAVLDSILNYDYGNEIITINQNYCDVWVNRASESASGFMSFRNVFPGLKPVLLTKNNVARNTISETNRKDIIIEFFNDVAALRSIISIFYIGNLQDQLQSGEALISLIQKEYHLKNE